MKSTFTQPPEVAAARTRDALGAPMPELVDVEKLGEVLDVKPKTIYAWVHRYEETGIPHYKLGRLVRFDPCEIEAWLRERHHAKMPARRSA